MFVVNNAPAIASNLVAAIADTDRPVMFTGDRGGDNDLAIAGDSTDLEYLLNSLRDFGIPEWVELELETSAEIIGELIVFSGVKLRLPAANRRR